MRPIVAIGEILIDFTPMVEEGHTVGFRMHAGGSPANVAVTLARLGAQVEFAGKTSTDFFGRFLVEHLRREGVGTRFVSQSSAPSTMAFVAIERGEPSFAFYGEGAADTLLLPHDLPDEFDAGVLHFGSISLLRGTTPATVIGLVERLRGCTVLSFDPNIRPSLVGDAAAYRRLLMRLFTAADIVKMSEVDARWMAPDRPARTLAVEIQAQGPALVVITEGSDGAYARTALTEAQVPVPAVPVIDTVGAGDAFTAGLLLALLERGASSRPALEELGVGDLRETLQFAVAAAALTCTRAGADPPRRLEVNHLLKR